jgi:hypothetical protein
MVLAALTGFALFVAGCAKATQDPSIPNAGGGGSSTPRPTGSTSALAYSQCMRSHGVPNFPDPQANGELAIDAGPDTGIDPESATYKGADAACKYLMPTRELDPSAAASMRAQNLRYAQCMRSHGIKDFPDPGADGALQIQGQRGSDLDPNSATYKSADAACKSFLPDGGSGGTLNDSGGKK